MKGAGFKRVLLKLGGESVQGENGRGIDAGRVSALAQQLKVVSGKGVQLGIVIGGGNILRGCEAELEGLGRETADKMGMLATGINALALRDGLERSGVECRVLAVSGMEKAGEPHSAAAAVRHMEQGRAVIFAGGTGNPYFTTDTAAAVRALEVGAEALLKATKVDGVYDRDPLADPAARRFDRLSYEDVIRDRLGVMDLVAVVLCMEHRLPIRVFRLDQLVEAASGGDVGTLVAGS